MGLIHSHFLIHELFEMPSSFTNSSDIKNENGLDLL